MLSENSQSQKVICSMIPFIWYSLEDKILRMNNRLLVVRFEAGRSLIQGSFWGDRCILYPNCGGGYINLCMC